MVVELDHLLDGFEAPVVHIRRSQLEVAQAGGAHLPRVVGVAGDLHAPRIVAPRPHSSVVELVVAHDRRLVAVVALPAPGEQGATRLLLRGEALASGEEVVEGRLVGELRALVAGDRHGDPCRGDLRRAERHLEELRVAASAHPREQRRRDLRRQRERAGLGDARQDVLPDPPDVGHLDVAHRRHDGLTLERAAARQDDLHRHRIDELARRPAVPEELRRVARVDRGDGPPAGHLLEEAEVGAPIVETVGMVERKSGGSEDVVLSPEKPIRPRMHGQRADSGPRILTADDRDVACPTGHGACRGDLLVPEQHLPQVRLARRHRVPRRLRRRRKLRSRPRCQGNDENRRQGGSGDALGQALAGEPVGLLTGHATAIRSLERAHRLIYPFVTSFSWCSTPPGAAEAAQGLVGGSIKPTSAFGRRRGAVRCWRYGPEV